MDCPMILLFGPAKAYHTRKRGLPRGQRQTRAWQGAAGSDLRGISLYGHAPGKYVPTWCGGLTAPIQSGAFFGDAMSLDKKCTASRHEMRFSC
jgi:hypothetical protein